MGVSKPIPKMASDSASLTSSGSQEDFESFSSDHAYQVFRANFATLVEEIQPEPILCDGLFSACVVSEEEYQFAIDEKKKDKQRVRKLLFKTSQSIKMKYEHFETFCNLLQKSDLLEHQKWAATLKRDVKELAQKEEANNQEGTNLKDLKDQLSVLKRGLSQSLENFEGKLDIMKEFIRTFITNSLKSGVSEKELSHQLDVICYQDMVVHSSLVDWTFDELKRLDAMNLFKRETLEDSSIVPVKLNDPVFQRQNFFSKERISKCLLLLKTVASCDRSNFKGFMSTHSHEFDEVSFSHSTDEENKLEPYIIAKIESTKEIYIAFLGQPSFDLWLENYRTFSQGISIQVSRIPIRFFIEQIQNNYTIFFTGFSMGGLLAVSVYASLWKDTCLSINNLLQNVACITYGTPLVPLEELEKTLKSVPSMKENYHFILLEDDIVPRLLQFLEVSSGKKGQLPRNAGELIFNQLTKWTHQVPTGNDSPQTTAIDITDLKAVLQEKKLAMSIDTRIFGTCHYIYADFSTSLLTAGAATDKLKVPDVSELEQVSKDKNIMTQHTLSKYENSLMKAKLLQPPSETGTSKPFSDVAILKPEVSSITFYRHGDQIALVLQGENLWFCSKIKITSESGSRVIDTVGTDATSRSIHFNYVPKDENDLLIEREATTVDVIYYSYFSKSMRKKVPVECKGEYHATFRQKQVARLTPDQVIIVSFLSALLEVKNHPYSSTRYKAICKFIEDAVKIVPIESICMAIAYGSDENAWICANELLSIKSKITPSFSLCIHLELACSRLKFGVSPNIIHEMQQQAMFFHYSSTGEFILPTDLNVDIGNDDIKVSTQPGVGVAEQAVISYQRSQSLSSFYQQFEESGTVIEKFEKFKLTQWQKMFRKRRNPCILCDVNIDEVYSTKPHCSQSKKLLSPAFVLKNGREELQKLQEEANEEIMQLLVEGEDLKVKEFSNEKMISTLDRIFTKDLSLCALVLGAFMQQQITVPFVDSEMDTAHILQTTESPPAVGVWALFCLDMIDFEKMTRDKKGKALVVKVEKYIKGIFAKGSEQRQEMLSEQLYAGKLQFLMQCLVSSVSCNTDYISYSFERQLAELCEKHDIRPNTRVQQLLINWKTYFKKNLLVYVREEFRPIVARWILWCLSIHHLREELASHTTIGVIGLSNSGKSCILKNLFRQKVVAGTTTMQRTTVPFLYNLEGLVNGLDVIDFPGMDDKDENIIKISNILLQISQLVILVIEYKRCNTRPVSQWVNILKDSGVPVLICLTHADKLFAATCLDENGDLKYDVDYAKRIIRQEYEKTCKNLEYPAPNWKVKFFCLSLDSDSKLNTPEGRKLLAEVGISFVDDVGLWIETELRDYMKQPDIAERLRNFMSSQTKMKKAKCSEDINSPPPVRGLEVLAEESFNVTSEGYKFAWDGYGLKIIFPPGAVTKINRQCFVKVISSGQYELPENTELVSSLYWVYFPEKFKNPVDIEIQHCCPPDSYTKGDLYFIKGQCDQELPYLFKKRQDGSFSSQDKKGFLSLHSFCILGIVRSFLPQPSITAPPPQMHSSSLASMLCVAKVYSKCEKKGKYIFEFVFLKDLESFHSAVDKLYLEKGWQLYVKHTFEFKSDVLLLNILQETNLKDWRYVERTPGKIRQKLVKHCHPESCPNHCLEFEWSKDEPADNISCPVKVSMGTGADIEQFELKLSLPLVDCTTNNVQMDHVANEFQGYDSSITSGNAMKVLRKSGFSFSVNSIQWLMVELEIETELRRRLQDQLKSTDYFEPLETAIDWWITNVDHSWSIFVATVRKVEKNPADKMESIILTLFR